nr:KH homology domain-containing protein 1-like [Rattus norvegicus]
MDAANENSWWMIPENFESPFVFFIDEDQEQHIFGHGDEYLRCVEEHSNTFIQLERWFTASGQTRVTVVGPFRSKHWLVDMIWNLCNQEACHRARGITNEVKPLGTPVRDLSLRNYVDYLK